jgi:hypothetical protein
MGENMGRCEITTTDIELAVAKYFGWRRNIIVPNISWGLGFKHELDVLIVTPAGRNYEIEIKISKSDFIRDFQKSHHHTSNRIHHLYYAIPSFMASFVMEKAPQHNGVLEIMANSRVVIRRYASLNKTARKLTSEEMTKLYELAAMRIWSLKEHLNAQRRKREG